MHFRNKVLFPNIVLLIVTLCQMEKEQAAMAEQLDGAESRSRQDNKRVLNLKGDKEDDNLIQVLAVDNARPVVRRDLRAGE